MSMDRILFYVIGFIVLASAVFVAVSKNLVRSIFMFFVTLLALAGLYVIALADFVAITQIVIYVGGILVLILFAFMLSGRETLAALQQNTNRFISLSNLPSLLLAVLFFMVMANIIFKIDANNLEWVKDSMIDEGMKTASPGNQINNIGINLMTTYLLPFEAISILLLMALAGAAHLARKEERA